MAYGRNNHGETKSVTYLILSTGQATGETQILESCVGSFFLFALPELSGSMSIGLSGIHYQGSTSLSQTLIALYKSPSVTDVADTTKVPISISLREALFVSRLWKCGHETIHSF